MTNIEQQVIQHGEQIKTLFEDQKRQDKVIDKIDSLTSAIAKMTVIQQDMIDEQKALRADVDGIKLQPAKDAHEIKQKIIIAIATCVATAVVTAIITLLIKGRI